MRAILYTTDAREVRVCYPMEEARRIACNGGGFLEPSRMEVQVERWIKQRVSERAARAWVNAMVFGGHVTASFLQLVIDKDVLPDIDGAHAPELIDPYRDLPARIFRNAWRRSLNGGPIEVDLEAARKLHLKRLYARAKKQHDARIEWRAVGRLVGDPEPQAVPFKRTAGAITLAGSIEELLAVWPA